jgi:hypothetical protein
MRLRGGMSSVAMGRMEAASGTDGGSGGRLAGVCAGVELGVVVSSEDDNGADAGAAAAVCEVLEAADEGGGAYLGC